MTITKKKVVISVSLILSILVIAVIVIAVLIHMGFGKPPSNREQTDVSNQ